MIELRIHGRGGQGGVTLAKIIAQIQFLRGRSVQAFGLYAAERSGAPLQAFVRIDDKRITTRNLIYEPDHIIVLDPTLISPAILVGLKPGGWILINTTTPLDDMVKQFPGYRVATVDATEIARRHELGTRAVPIVNTTLAGSVAAVFEYPLSWVEDALTELGFSPNNMAAAREAFAATALGAPPTAKAEPVAPLRETGRIPGLVDGNLGSLPPIHTGQWATQRPARHRFTPPCNHVCPAGNDVQGFLAHLAKDEVDAALATLYRTSPFPGVCGRVCPAPCIEACNRSSLDEPVNVRELERYAADHGNLRLEKAPPRKENVSIVGSGPAGLSCAYHLALLGYRVDLYEAGEGLGGLLRTGIPPYRLPRDVLDREVQRILDLGVVAHLNTRITKRELLALTRRSSAVYVATGLQEVRSLNLGQIDRRVVQQGIDFLDRANRNEVRADGKRVVVAGGGNTAFDAARTALRLGAASVSIVYRRSREEMPAIKEEIEEAIEEGVRVDYQVTPIRLEPGNDAWRLRCVRTRLGEPDESGRRRPVTIEGSDFDLPCDLVILALGQSGDLSIFPEGTEVRDGKALLGLTSVPVFVGGDLHANEGTVTAAIGDGRKTARHIHQVLSGECLFDGHLSGPPEPTEDTVVQPEDLRMHLFERSPQHHGRTISMALRRTSYAEIRAGLPDPAEAKRCLSCGVCNYCDRCRTYCPEGVVRRVDNRYEFDYEYCKGCGLCSTECPRNVILMAHL